GFLLKRSAATAAECGAAADVPKKRQNGGQEGTPPALEIDTPSNAVRSGLARVSGKGKKSVRGPCELKNSSSSSPGSRTSIAPTAITSGTAGWPMMLPEGVTYS